MVLQQHHQLPVERRQENEGHADHAQGDHGNLGVGQVDRGDRHAEQVAAEHAEHIGREADPEHRRRPFREIEHLAEDAPPEEVEDAAGAEHQGIDNEIIPSLSAQQHEADECGHDHGHAHIEHLRTVHLHGQAAQDDQCRDVGHCPVPVCQQGQMGEGGVEDLIHQPGIDGDHKNEEAEQQQGQPHGDLRFGCAGSDEGLSPFRGQDKDEERPQGEAQEGQAEAAGRRPQGSEQS